jgi:excisionase family DNA binding protein
VTTPSPSTSPSPVTISDIVARWKARRSEWTRFGIQVEGARLADEVLADLERVLRTSTEEVLSLAEAAYTSGYSADHLRRLVRDGRLPAERRGRRLHFRRRDLPKKPERTVDRLPPAGYDPAADARQVAARRSFGGAHG